MKGLFIFVAIWVATVAWVDCAVWIGRPEVKPERFKNEPGCYDSSSDKVIPFGFSYPIGNCVRLECSRSGAIHGATCGVVGTVKPCYVVKGDLSLPYPDCCDNVECPSPNFINDNKL